MTKDTFKKGIVIFTACIKGFKVEPDKVAVWYELLKDMPDEVFIKAIEVIAKTRTDLYPGTNIVALIREQAGQVTGAALPLETQAMLAYEKVEKAFSNIGIYKTVVFDDPVIHAVMQNLSGDKAWTEYCDLPTKELKWYRKDFEKTYINLAPLVFQGKVNPPKQLLGIHAAEEHPTEEALRPALIGDSQKILEWTGQKALTE